MEKKRKKLFLLSGLRNLKSQEIPRYGVHAQKKEKEKLK